MNDLNASKTEIAAGIADLVAKDFEAFAGDLSAEQKKLFLRFGQACAMHGLYSDAQVLKWFEEAQNLRRQLQATSTVEKKPDAEASSFMQPGPAGAEAHPADVVAAADWLAAFRHKAEDASRTADTVRGYADRCDNDSALLMHLAAIRKYDPIWAGDERDSLDALRDRLLQGAAAPAPATAVKPQTPKL